MTAARTYLDWNATAPLLPEARAAMVEAFDLFANPSSVHGEGRAARRVVEAAREEVAALVGARPSEVVFMSGGTEANNMVLAAGWDTVHVAGIEHDSVLAPARSSGARIVALPVDRRGLVRSEDVAQAADGKGRGLVSLQLANNETGIVQSVAEVAGIAREHKLVTHTDAVQAAGRMAIDMAALGVDLLTLSAHKLGGPKGVGALIAKDGVALPALLQGGGQERRRRAGTENVAGIAGFGAAARVARQRLAGGEDGCAVLRDRLEQGLKAITPEAMIVGSDAPRLENTTCVAVEGASAETLVIALDLAGVAVSAGAACSSGKVGPSHVLAAMGLAPKVARGAIRISIGPATTQAHVDHFLHVWHRIAGDGALRRRAVA